jgi:hypothetical protein
VPGRVSTTWTSSRNAWTVSRTSVGADAECIHAGRPAVRNPVSSKCADPAPAIRVVITGTTMARTWEATRVVRPTTVAAATTTPNRSRRVCTVRDVDRN